MELDLAALMKGKSKKKAPPPDDYAAEPEEEEGDEMDGPALLEQFFAQGKAKDFEGAWETLQEAVALAAEED
jgi:hypothetical protein